MIYCKIENGLVVDRALFDEPMPTDWPDYSAWVHNDEAQIGWSYANGVFTPPAPAPTPPVAPVPYSLPVSVLWTRMSDEEAEAFDTAMSTATPLRLRKAFNSATSLPSESEVFAFTKNVLKTALSAARADEITVAYYGLMAAMTAEEE